MNNEKDMKRGTKIVFYDFLYSVFIANWEYFMGKKRIQEYIHYMSEEEKKWMYRYEEMTDEEIYGMLRQKNTEVKRQLKKEDIPYAGLLKKRFGPWPRLLEAAGLKKQK